MKPALLNHALQFAASAHRNQVRKGTDVPYIVHPVGVAMILAEYEFPESVIAAGFLHDTLEDAGVTADTLEREFGKEIRGIVCACSEPDKSLPWRVRKQHTIDVLRTASVAAADKLDNLRAMRMDIATEGHELWKRFNHGLDDQHWYYHTLQSRKMHWRNVLDG